MFALQLSFERRLWNFFENYNYFLVSEGHAIEMIDEIIDEKEENVKIETIKEMVDLTKLIDGCFS